MDYEVVRSDRGESKQIYHINFLKRWNDVIPVALVMMLPERDEFGPEVPVPGPTPPVGFSEHLSASQAANVAGVQFADVPR